MMMPQPRACTRAAGTVHTGCAVVHVEPAEGRRSRGLPAEDSGKRLASPVKKITCAVPGMSQI